MPTLAVSRQARSSTIIRRAFSFFGSAPALLCTTGSVGWAVLIAWTALVLMSIDLSTGAPRFTFTLSSDYSACSPAPRSPGHLIAPVFGWLCLVRSSRTQSGSIDPRPHCDQGLRPAAAWIAALGVAAQDDTKSGATHAQNSPVSRSCSVFPGCQPANVRLPLGNSESVTCLPRSKV